MGRIQYGTLILVAFLGGLAGGSVSTKFLSGETALAQNEKRPLKYNQIYAGKIIAQEYFLQAGTVGGPLDTEISIPRAVLTTKPDGSPKLIMQDTNGTPRFSIHLNDNDGVTLTFFNLKGKKKLRLSEKSAPGKNQVGPTLALFDEHGKIRSQIGVQSDGNPFLSLNDPPLKNEDAGRAIRLCLNKKDEASLSVFGMEGHQRAKLGIDSNRICLSIKDPNGQTRAELGNTDLAFGKDGSLKKASSGELSVEQRLPSSLVLYNENEKVLWSAP